MFITKSQAAAARRRARLMKKTRADLPYGVWKCADGREVLFNRRYRPLAERLADGTCRPADPAETVRFVRQRFLYSPPFAPWNDRETLKKCQAILAEFAPRMEG